MAWSNLKTLLGNRNAARILSALLTLASPEVPIRAVVAVTSDRSAVFAFVDGLTMNATFAVPCLALTTHTRIPFVRSLTDQPKARNQPKAM